MYGMEEARGRGGGIDRGKGQSLCVRVALVDSVHVHDWEIEQNGKKRTTTRLRG